MSPKEVSPSNRFTGLVTTTPRCLRTRDGHTILSFRFAIGKHTQTGNGPDESEYCTAIIEGAYAEHLNGQLYRGCTVDATGVSKNYDCTMEDGTLIQNWEFHVSEVHSFTLPNIRAVPRQATGVIEPPVIRLVR